MLPAGLGKEACNTTTIALIDTVFFEAQPCLNDTSAVSEILRMNEKAMTSARVEPPVLVGIGLTGWMVSEAEVMNTRTNANSFSDWVNCRIRKYCCDVWKGMSICVHFGLGRR